jgi:hypothetical protein
MREDVLACKGKNSQDQGQYGSMKRHASSHDRKRLI